MITNRKVYYPGCRPKQPLCHAAFRTIFKIGRNSFKMYRKRVPLSLLCVSVSVRVFVRSFVFWLFLFLFLRDSTARKRGTERDCTKVYYVYFFAGMFKTNSRHTFYVVLIMPLVSCALDGRGEHALSSGCVVLYMDTVPKDTPVHIQQLTRARVGYLYVYV